MHVQIHMGNEPAPQIQEEAEWYKENNHIVETAQTVTTYDQKATIQEGMAWSRSRV